MTGCKSHGVRVDPDDCEACRKLEAYHSGQWLLRPDALYDARDKLLHKATVRLTYTASGTPYKWSSRCACGWRGLSWQWRRVDEEEGELPYVTGALALALEHVGLLPNASPYRPRYATGGIVKGAGSPTDDRIPPWLDNGYVVRKTWDHECPKRLATMTLRRGEPCGPCGMVER